MSRRVAVITEAQRTCAHVFHDIYCELCGIHHASTRKPAPLADKFWPKVDRSGGPEACWPFTGAKTEHGYGKIGHLGKILTAPRVAWELTHGPLPAEKPNYHGLCVMHVCDNPPCCNPAHLKLGSQADNLKDCVSKGRGRPYGNRYRRAGSP